MIVKATPDLMPRGLAREIGSSQPPPPGDQAGPTKEFAELMKGSDRSERKEEKPGRESEGKRLTERESGTPLNKKQLRKATAVREKPEASTDASTDDSSDDVSPNAQSLMQAPPVVKRDEKLEVEEGTSSIEDVSAPAQARESAMVDFMNKMSDEFGVAPEKIVEAFSKMSEDSLMAPPEESMKEFLTALDIPADKMPIAKDMYSQMLSATGEADLQEKLDAIDSALESLDASLDSSLGEVANYQSDLMTPQEQALSALSENADDLEQALVGQSTGSVAKDAATVQRAADDMNARLAEMMRKPQSEEPALEAIPLAATETPVTDDLSTPVVAPTVLAGSMVQPQAQDSSSQGQADSQNQGQGQGQSQFAKELKVDAKPAKVDAKAAEFSTEVTPLQDPGATPVLAQAPTGPSIQVSSSAAGTATLGRPMTGDEEAANLKAVLNQATATLKKGGGEIEMAMNPEGIGKVRVKVSIDDGQVNIQMLTENDTAKKMLEKGLGELRSSLAEHQLKVENLKVDVGSDIKKQMDQNPDQGREQTRQFAQDFLGRFRDERGGFNRGFMENQGLRKSYGGGKRPEMEASATTRAPGSANTGSSKRLNLVA